MSQNTGSRAVKPTKTSSGYFLFELLISAMMIAAIVVLAFPTYQDFSPEFEVTSEVPTLEQSEAATESFMPDDAADLAAEQEAEGKENISETSAS